MSKRIELIREDLGYNKKEMARNLGITQNSYTSYIQGMRQIPTDIVQHLGLNYGINLDWFFSGKGEIYSGISRTSKAVLERLKSEVFAKSDRDLAKILEVNENTLRGWIHRNSLDHLLIISFCQQNGIDNNHIFFGKKHKGESDVKQIEIPSDCIHSLYEAISLADNEQEVADHIKHSTRKTLIKLIEQVSEKPEAIDRMLRIIFSYSNSFAVFALKTLNVIMEEKPAGKDGLIEGIKKLLKEGCGVGDVHVSKIDVTKMAVMIENLDEEAIQNLIQHIDMIRSHIKDSI